MLAFGLKLIDFIYKGKFSKKHKHLGDDLQIIREEVENIQRHFNICIESIDYETEKVNIDKFSKNKKELRNIEYNFDIIVVLFDKYCYKELIALEIENTKSLINNLDTSERKNSIFQYLKNKLEGIKKDIFNLNVDFKNITKYLDENFEKEHILKTTKSKNLFEKIKEEYNLMDKLFDGYFTKSSLNNYIIEIDTYFFELNIGIKRLNANNDFVKRQKLKYANLFRNVEGRALDEIQQECIIKDELNNLVIAGAGSGKTTTIVGKVKYLIDVLGYNSQEILIISFTNDSASEMKNRIEKSVNCSNLNAMTFHSLGRTIINKVEAREVKIRSEDSSKYIKSKIEEFCKDVEYQKKYNKFFIEYLQPYKNMFEFRTLGDYVNYMARMKMKSLNDEKLKSMEEIEIANFLYLNGIEYKYEESYPYYKGRYKPDFYLPEYNVYIEHFGIDRNGNVPKFFSRKFGKSPKATYNDSMKWKRNLHTKNRTKLIETYSYEKIEGNLLKGLKNKLSTYNIKLKPKSESDIYNMIEKKYKNKMDSINSLIVSFISYIRNNNISLENVKNKINYSSCDYEKRRRNLFIEIIEPIIENYKLDLEKKRQIDFSDMINKAANYVESSSYKSQYKYIIIDEYQDISKSRLRLVKGLKEQTKAKIFCVGDDWQSIYKFTGSEVALFTRFEKYLGYTERTRLKYTFRCNQSIVKASSEFIQKNPNQYKKNVVSYSYEKNGNEEIVNVKDSLKIIYGRKNTELKNNFFNILNNLPHNSTVTLLGRYANDFNQYDDKKRLINIISTKGIIEKIIYKERKDLIIEYKTIHKSKGLESDYIIVLNNKDDSYGFPSKIEDDPIFNLIKDEEDNYIFAEERRLFYVALTRTKNDVYLMVERDNRSCFIKELERDYNICDKKNIHKGVPEKTCKVCNANMVLRKGSFWGCENFPYCRNMESINEKPVSKIKLS
jgi:DNA helicase-4